MNRPLWRLLAAVVAASALAAPASAQKKDEFGFQVTSLLAREHPYYGAGFSAAHRMGGRARIALGVLYGISDAEPTARANLTGHLMASPTRPRGVGFYGFGGVGFEAGWRDQGYLVLGLGLETNPGGGGGVHIEAGIGGGFLLSAGWRARWLGPHPPR
jgi:opacity protein-like surface antigen